VGIFHWAVTLHEVSLAISASFENKTPPLVQTNSPVVLYCSGTEEGFTKSISLMEVGQSTNKIYQQTKSLISVVLQSTLIL